MLNNMVVNLPCLSTYKDNQSFRSTFSKELSPRYGAYQVYQLYEPTGCDIVKNEVYENDPRVVHGPDGHYPAKYQHYFEISLIGYNVTAYSFRIKTTFGNGGTHLSPPI
jgi:hypothetical protein